MYLCSRKSVTNSNKPKIEENNAVSNRHIVFPTIICLHGVLLLHEIPEEITHAEALDVDSSVWVFLFLYPRAVYPSK